jgi:hypothetical protein
LAQPAQAGFDVPGKEESSFPDLKEGIHLVGGSLNRVTELTVDGVLQKAQTEFKRTTIEVTVPTTAAKELRVEGFLLAGKLRVMIDGKEGKLADLKKGMHVSLRVVKDSALAVTAEIRAGNPVESLQPTEADSTRLSTQQDLSDLVFIDSINPFNVRRLSPYQQTAPIK